MIWPFKRKPAPDPLGIRLRVAHVDDAPPADVNTPGERRLRLEPIDEANTGFVVQGGFRLDIQAADHPGRTLSEGDVLTANLTLEKQR